MVMIMVTSVFPPDTAGELLKKYNEIQEQYPLPSFIKQKQGGLRWIKEGMKGVAIYTVAKGSIAAALNYVYRYEGEFASFEGYSNEIEALLELEDLSGVIPS